jgi:hypothetical protein
VCNDIHFMSVLCGTALLRGAIRLAESRLLLRATDMSATGAISVEVHTRFTPLACGSMDLDRSVVLWRVADDCVAEVLALLWCLRI